MLSTQKNGDAIFVRHAESLFNAETLEYVNRKKIEFDWAHLSQDHEYLASHKYSPHLVDATITPKGYEECSKARELLVDYQPDVILVSPLNRTLLTCSLIFPNPSCPVIVEPLLSESVRSSCDISSDIPSKKALYPNYNFQKLEKEGDFWFIHNDSAENQAAYMKVMAQHSGKSYEEIMKAILQMMLQTWMFETATNLRHRTDKVKALLREYRKQYKKIAVVSHYNIIRFTLAKEFNQLDEPFHCLIGNCEILPAQISQL